MKVLWLSVTPSLYGDNTLGGKWVISLQKAVMKYRPDIQLGIAFEHTDKIFKMEKDGISYYPMNLGNRQIDKLKLKFHFKFYWDTLKPQIEEIINNFHPDIIQCFGSEWPYGYVVEMTDVPVVIHMQGFLNIYTLSAEMSRQRLSFWNTVNPRQIIKRWYSQNRDKHKDKMEKEIMKKNHYFLGRTKWDQEIVSFFSPDSKYYYCPEAIREEIYETTLRWKFHDKELMQLITISSGSDLKGNEIILKTANILKNFGFPFVWRVAGNITTIKKYEKNLGINHADVGVDLIGLINEQQIVNELINADIYIHTAIIDNSPNSLCEAQLVGCPVVSTYVGGIPQLVDDNKTGLFYPYNEPYTLAFKIMGLYRNRAMLEYLSSNEIEMSHDRHNPEEITKILHSIYKQILKNNEGKN